mgnify:CR=1 FL=1
MELDCRYRPTFLVWWASVGLEWYGEKLSWLFPRSLMPTVSLTAIRRSKRNYSESATETLLEGEQIVSSNWEPCLYEILDEGITELISRVAETIPNSTVLVCADYLAHSFQAFTEWNRENRLSLPVYSSHISPGISPFYVVYEIKPEEVSRQKIFMTYDNWCETNLGIAFLFVSNKDDFLDHILNNQGVYFAGDLDSVEPPISSTAHLVDNLIRNVLGEYRLPEFADAMIVPYGDEVREQMLFLHRHLRVERMLTIIQSTFRLPLIASYPSPEELKAWDWSLELPGDIKWIEAYDTE